MMVQSNAATPPAGGGAVMVAATSRISWRTQICALNCPLVVLCGHDGGLTQGTPCTSMPTSSIHLIQITRERHCGLLHPLERCGTASVSCL